MELNITLDDNSIVEETFFKNTDVKIAQQSWKMMVNLAAQSLT